MLTEGATSHAGRRYSRHACSVVSQEPPRPSAEPATLADPAAPQQQAASA